MNTPAPKPTDTDNLVRELADHDGIVKVRPDLVKGRLEIEFDPVRLDEDEVREWISNHGKTISTVLEKSLYRLSTSACEACALKLERKVAKIPGVRRASATYLGKVLSVTFDPSEIASPAMLDRLRQAGAKVQPIARGAKSARPSFREQLLSGVLNDEISCAGGLLALVSALLVEKSIRVGMGSNLLYLAAYILAGQQGLRSAIASLRERVLDVDFLMILAALGAAIIGAPFEGALLLFLFSLSNVLQQRAMDRTRRAIESLLELRPAVALVKREFTSVPLEEVQVGETVLVRPGEQIPVDGTVSEGSTHVDESSLTGESMPVAKTIGGGIFAGTLNQSGAIEMKVTKRSEDSTVAKLVELVAEAQAEKSGTQRFLEKAEQYYAMGVIALTALVFLIPFLMGEPASKAFYRAMTIMVVASPCALVISTPATVLSAIGGAARRGILIKGGSHLEMAARIDIVALDKTGTLTVGKPSLTHIVTAAGAEAVDKSLSASTAELLQDAAALEARSEHPLARAIVKAAADLELDVPEARDFQATTGKGAEAALPSGVRHIVGSERFLAELGAANMDDFAAARTYQSEGKTCVWHGIRQDGGVVAKAVLVMADTLRPEARDLVRSLHRLGVKKIVMLTGDQQLVAESIAREAGIDEIHAGLLPEDKLKVISTLKKSGRVMMVGDGVNDAPALASADLGVAMGAAGTDIAMETADVVLMGDRLENIPLLLAEARRAKRVLTQNLVFASSVIVFLILAALGFALPLPLGVVGHEGSTVLVCLNGLRLLLPARNSKT